MSGLIDYLRTHGRGMSQRVLDEMYRDPFWTERFGTRGRDRADEDSDFHMSYVIAGLESGGDPAVIQRYARWLRDVLVARGMCTEHLAENFRLLAAEIAASGAPAPEAATRLLHSAGESLLYPPGAARTLQDAQARVAVEIERRFRAQHPEGWAHAAGRGPEALHHDIVNYLSFVADALFQSKPEILAAHTKWWIGHVNGAGTQGAEVEALVRCVHAVLAAAGDDDAARLVAGILAGVQPEIP